MHKNALQSAAGAQEQPASIYSHVLTNSSKAPFTQYNLLSNRFDKRLYRVYSRLNNLV